MAVDVLKKSKEKKPVAVDASELEKQFKLQFTNQVFNVGQEVAINYGVEGERETLKLTVTVIDNARMAEKGQEGKVGPGERISSPNQTKPMPCRDQQSRPSHSSVHHFL